MNFEKMREIANKKTIRAVSVALLLLAGKTAVANTETGAKTNTEAKSKAASNKEIMALNTDKAAFVNDKNTYVVSGKEMLEMEVANNFELVKLDFDVNYETDKANLAEQAQVEISEQFTGFLGNINQANFQAAEEADWQVVSSCDERPTNVWGEKGNEALATARGEALIRLLQEDLKKYEFSGLSAEQVAALKNKSIENAIVAAHQDHKGETLITDIINPETGRNYTEAEVQDIKQNNQVKYLSLLAQNRISQFRAEIPVFKLEKMGLVDSLPRVPNKAPHFENIEKPDLTSLVKKFPEYKNIILLLDNSPSMRDDKEKLSEEIAKQQRSLNGIKFFIGHYSDKLQKLISADSAQAGQEIIAEVGMGSEHELSVQAPAEAWDRIGADIKSEDKTLILVNTDEALQRFSSADLNKLDSLPDNVEVKFVFHLGGGRCLDIPLSVVQNSVDKINDKGIANLKKFLANTEKQLSKLHVRQLNTADRDADRQLKKMITALEKQQADITARMAGINEYHASRKINLHEFTDENGQTARLEIY
ncbi:MAG: hypothetical protein HY931_04715 [Candidatus Falkowbacteria bacterium]|nr:MAG: hypothetical protein HY931_04715 [Candidatus Falkowbacteria bacterium]